jgi:hypothetical protein
MLILSGLGLMHARRTSADTEILSGRTAHTTKPVEATRNSGNGLAAPAAGS